jgi:predicted ribosomally synthesized peptide with nif11-like leader
MAGVQEFAKKLAEDAEFAKQFEGVESTEELLEKIKAAGYEVTAEALQSLAGGDGELDDDELDNINGGIAIARHALATRSQSKGIKTIPATGNSSGIVNSVVTNRTGSKSTAKKSTNKGLVHC